MVLFSETCTGPIYFEIYCKWILLVDELALRHINWYLKFYHVPNICA